MKSITIRFTVTTVTSHKATVDVPDDCDPTTSKGRANVADALHDQHADCDETFDPGGDPPTLHVILPGGAPLPWG